MRSRTDLTLCWLRLWLFVRNEGRGGALGSTLPHNPFHIVHHLYNVQCAVCVCACVSCAGYLGMNVLLEMCW